MIENQRLYKLESILNNFISNIHDLIPKEWYDYEPPLYDKQISLLYLPIRTLIQEYLEYRNINQ